MAGRFKLKREVFGEPSKWFVEVLKTHKGFLGFTESKIILTKEFKTEKEVDSFIRQHRKKSLANIRYAVDCVWANKF